MALGSSGGLISIWCNFKVFFDIFFYGPSFVFVFSGGRGGGHKSVCFVVTVYYTYLLVDKRVMHVELIQRIGGET